MSSLINLFLQFGVIQCKKTKKPSGSIVIYTLQSSASDFESFDYVIKNC